MYFKRIYVCFCPKNSSLPCFCTSYEHFYILLVTQLRTTFLWSETLTWFLRHWIVKHQNFVSFASLLSTNKYFSGWHTRVLAYPVHIEITVFVFFLCQKASNTTSTAVIDTLNITLSLELILLFYYKRQTSLELITMTIKSFLIRSGSFEKVKAKNILKFPSAVYFLHNAFFNYLCVVLTWSHLRVGFGGGRSEHWLCLFVFSLQLACLLSVAHPPSHART